jgi:hypothetical protein
VGLFDFFKSNKDASGRKANPADKWAERAGDKRAQNLDRQQALHELAQMGTAESAQALLKRFTFVVDPSITDQEEKELAFAGVIRAGDKAIDPIRTFAARAESLSYSMRLLRELVDEDSFVKELVGWLARWDTEYAKFIDPKLQLLSALEDFKHPDIAAAVTGFLEDVNETARFHAVGALLVQEDEATLAPLLDAFEADESVRVKARIADGIVARGWVVPDERRDTVRRALSYDYSINGEGRFQKR